MDNNLPNGEMEMALVALLNALKDYNRALAMVGREANQLATELIIHLGNELEQKPQEA